MLTRLANAHRGAKVHSNASMPCLMPMTLLSSSLSAYNCPQQYSPTQKKKKKKRSVVNPALP